MLLNDKQIITLINGNDLYNDKGEVIVAANRISNSRQLVENGFISLISKDVNGKKVISYGVSSAGYDARLADEFIVFKSLSYNTNKFIDPKNFDSSLTEKVKCNELILNPGCFTLARTIEKFNMPRNLTATCLGKSTYARTGIIVNTTPLEEEWYGTVTLELHNASPLPVKLYANEGICQFLFHTTEDPAISYFDRGGKYQNQIDVTLPKV